MIKYVVNYRPLVSLSHLPLDFGDPASRMGRGAGGGRGATRMPIGDSGGEFPAGSHVQPAQPAHVACTGVCMLCLAV